MSKRFEDHAIIPLEWFYETLEKRLVRNQVKLEDLFLCVPAAQEADTIYEIPYKNQLNYISLSLWTLLAQNNKLRVFFIKRERLSKITLLHKSRFAYPKVGIASQEKIYDLAGRDIGAAALSAAKEKPKERVN